MSQSPDSFLDGLVNKLGEALQPPPWLVQERLKRQAGRLVEAHWRHFTVRLQATPAGLLDLGPAQAQPDLTLTLTDESPFALAQAALRGDKPAVRIAGDVQLAAEVQWLVDHVRWDVEEDISRIIGDAPAHALGQAARTMADAVRKFVGKPQAPAGKE